MKKISKLLALCLAIFMLCFGFTSCLLTPPGDEGGSEGDQNPSGDGQTPGGDNQTPGGDNQTPGGDNQTPGGDNQTPGGDNQTPGGDNQTPGGDNQTPGGDDNTQGGGNTPGTPGQPGTPDDPTPDEPGNDDPEIEIPDVTLPEGEYAYVLENVSATLNDKEILIDLAELYLSLNSEGELIGYGTGLASFNSSVLKGVSDAGATLYIEGTTAYLDVIVNGSFENDKSDRYTMAVELDQMETLTAALFGYINMHFNEDGMIPANVAYLQTVIKHLPEIISWLEESFIPAISPIINESADVLLGKLDAATADFFKTTEKPDGTTVKSFDLAVLKKFNTETLAQSTVSELIDIAFGEGVYAKIKDEIPNILMITVGDLIEMYEDKGGNIEALLDSLDSLAELLTGNEGITVEMIIGIEEDIGDLITDPTVTSVSVAQAISLMFPEQAPDLKAIADIINSFFADLESKTIYDFIDIELLTAANVNYVIDLMNNMITYKITLDKDGNFVSLNQGFNTGKIILQGNYLDCSFKANASGVIEFELSMKAKDAVIDSSFTARVIDASSVQVDEARIAEIKERISKGSELSDEEIVAIVDKMMASTSSGGAAVPEYELEYIRENGKIVALVMRYEYDSGNPEYGYGTYSLHEITVHFDEITLVLVKDGCGDTLDIALMNPSDYTTRFYSYIINEDGTSNLEELLAQGKPSWVSADISATGMTFGRGANGELLTSPADYTCTYMYGDTEEAAAGCTGIGHYNQKCHDCGDSYRVFVSNGHKEKYAYSLDGSTFICKTTCSECSANLGEFKATLSIPEGASLAVDSETGALTISGAPDGVFEITTIGGGYIAKMTYRSFDGKTYTHSDIVTDFIVLGLGTVNMCGDEIVIYPEGYLPSGTMLITLTCVNEYK